MAWPEQASFLLAHGAFYALGAYASITRYLGFGPAVVLSPVAVALLGIFFERFILRRFYTADPILSLLVSFGLAMVTEQAIRIIWGAAPLSAAILPAFRGSVWSGTSCSRAIACWSSLQSRLCFSRGRDEMNRGSRPTSTQALSLGRWDLSLL